SAAHTYLNVQADAHSKVGKKVAKRRESRRSRRSRKCPNRKNRTNRLANKARIPAGTRARWDWQLRVLEWLSKLYPLTHVCVEDIKARTIQRAKKWNQSLSPLEVGKQWFYSEIEKRWELLTLQGWETKEIRDQLGLKKSSKKLSETFDAHCVDSWCLAHHTVGGLEIPDNTTLLCISPIPIKRRELHRQQAAILGKGLVKNTLIRHVKYGFARLAGVNAKGLFSIYSMENKRLTTSAKRSDFRVLTRLNFYYRIGVSSPE
ncbi:RRXRR domain-containing protein, partial [Candidatus Poribacteria bacterium]|nr:RRXRR domain-containing protein [Candidatus Poribacteria bacterium]